MDSGSVRKTEEGGSNPVAGATYGLFSDEDCLNLIYQFPQTDSNGEAVTADKYPCGEQYYVKEIEAPSGYELSETIYPVKIEAKEETEIVYELAVTDKKTPTRIQIIKVDERNNPLKGVQLQRIPVQRKTITQGSSVPFFRRRTLQVVSDIDV